MPDGQTLKDRATELLTKCKSGALVAQLLCWTICCCLRGAKGVAEGFSLHVLEPCEKFIKHRVHLMVPLNNQFVLSSFDLCGCIERQKHFD